MKNDLKLPTGFANPIAQPDRSNRDAWQARNRSWWESNPMRYDWRAPITAPEFSKEFFDEIDKRFFEDSRHYMPPKNHFFDEIIPFDDLPRADVLEIGVGNGSHAQLIAPHCKSYSGIDLTEYAVMSTRKRLELRGIRGEIRRMDAEKLDFPDESFDFIWTWGVIHHSADTGRILSEMKRVLRPRGSARVMVYHRSFLAYYIFNGFFRGILAGGLFKTGSLHELVQLSTDGALARIYRPHEWRTLVRERGLQLERWCVKGQKAELFPLPASGLKDLMMTMTPDAVARLLLNRCRQGSFLISTLRKP
jgi:SAM-dependent methyltransferase